MPAAHLELARGSEAVAARSVVYRALARGFTPPHPALQVREIASELAEAARALPYGLATDLPSADPAALQAAYTALFEVGGDQGGPSFLYEGEHSGGRMKVLDDTLRFYHHFSLHLSETQHDRPDHLATELEFMHALTFQEAALVQGAGDPTPLRRAERDFLRAHLAPFVEAVGERLAGRTAPFYPALAAAAAAFCRADLGYLEAQA